MADDLKARFDELEARISKGLEKGWVEKAFEHFDERLSSLEEGQKKPKDDTKTEADEDAAKEDAGKLKSISDINYMTIEEFEKRKFSYEQEHYAIDVVMGQQSLRKGARTGDAKSPDVTIITTTTDDKGSGRRPDFDLPRFIQINSPPLIDLLKLHTNLDPAKVYGPYVILAPFKSICFNASLLRDLPVDRSDDKGKVGVSGSPSLSSADAEEGLRSAENDSPSDDQKAWDDLQCLLKLYDAHIKPWWDYMRGRAPQNVQYGDLSALYQPGDLVVTPDEPQRVYRVVKITGARPFLHHLCSTRFGQAVGAIEGDRDKDVQDSEGIEGAKTAKIQRNRKPQGDIPTESRNWSVFDIDCYSLAYNGKTFGPVLKSFQITYFPGHRDLRQLKIYPARFISEKLRQEYIDDGRKFLKYSHAGLQSYDGRTLTRLSSGDALTNAIGGTLLSRDVANDIVIDFDLAYQYNPRWEITPHMILYRDLKGQDEEEDHIDSSNLPTDARLRDADLDIEYFEPKDEREFDRLRREDIWLIKSEDGVDVKHEEWEELLVGRSEDEYMLLPTQVFGYILRIQEWACFDVTNKAKWNDTKQSSDNWDELQLPLGHKQTLSSQMEWHLHNKRHGAEPFSFDFIEGKGEGLIILLHGAPGVGKTSTGESLARLYGRPLLPITCGNLGLKAQEVEAALSENFRLAEAWNCIVLLDEADIFLARREKKDLDRNALVSVFLRTLEYYTGILILTTNRPGDFDEAFRSRINVGLHYPHLTKDMTKAIWESSLARLEKHVADGSRNLSIQDRDAIIRFGQRHYEAYRTKLSRSPWNGRQIRNAFQSAVALAQHKAFGSRSLSKSGRADSVPPPGTHAILSWEVFREVALATLDFEIYLVETHGGWTDDEMAAGQSLRAIDSGDGSDIRQTAKERRKIKPEESREIIKSLHPDMRPYAPEPSPFADPFLERRPTMNARISSNGTPIHGHTPVQPPRAYASPAPSNYYTPSAPPATQQAAPIYHSQQGAVAAPPAHYNASPQPYYVNPQPGTQAPPSNLQSPPPQYQVPYQTPPPDTLAPMLSGQYPTQTTPGAQQPTNQYQPQISNHQAQYQSLPAQASHIAQQTQLPPVTQLLPQTSDGQHQYQPVPTQAAQSVPQQQYPVQTSIETQQQQ